MTKMTQIDAPRRELSIGFCLVKNRSVLRKLRPYTIDAPKLVFRTFCRTPIKTRQLIIHVITVLYVYVLRRLNNLIRIRRCAWCSNGRRTKRGTAVEGGFFYSTVSTRTALSTSFEVTGGHLSPPPANLVYEQTFL